MNTLADQLAEVSVPGDAQHFSPDVSNSTIKLLHNYRFALSQKKIIYIYIYIYIYMYTYKEQND